MCYYFLAICEISESFFKLLLLYKSTFFQPYVILNLWVSFYVEHKEDILKMLVIKQLMVPIDFQSISFPTREVNGDQQLFGSLNYLLLRVSKWWQNFHSFAVD